MGDFALPFGGDLSASPSGDFATVDHDLKTIQRIIRRLCTNPRVVLPDGEILDADYRYSPSYGAGVGRVVGSAASQQDLNQLENAVRQTLRAESGVSQATPPTITMTIVSGGVILRVTYVSAYNAQVVNLPALVFS